jgi:sigma-E factor negative regulatory protein RseC
MEMEEEGTVVEVRGGGTMVRAAAKPQCAGCGASATCHATGQGGEKIVEVENGMGAAPGDRVMIAVPGGAFLRATFQAYMVPVLGILGGAGIAQVLVQAIAGPGAAGMAAGLGGLLGGFLSVAALRRLRRDRPVGADLRPKIVRIL